MQEEELINTENVISKKVTLTGILLLVLCLVLYSVPWPGIFSVHIISIDDLAIFFLFSRVLYWVILGIIFIYVIKKEKQRILLWTEKGYSFGNHLSFFFVMLAVVTSGLILIQSAISFFHLDAQSKQIDHLKNLFRNYFVLAPVAAITAGVTEELLFRGYLMPRLQLLFNNKYITVIVSSLLFGAVHIGYGTVINVVAPVFIGIVFAIYYQKFRNIGSLIFFHFMWDMMVTCLLVRHG